MNKYIDAEKLIAEIEDRLHCNGAFDEVGDYAWHYDQGMVAAYNHIKEFIASLQQEQPVHSHYTKVREIKTGRVFWAEYSSEAAEWYEAGTGKAYSISNVEIVKEQPEVDLEKEIEEQIRSIFYDLDGIAIIGTSQYASVEDMEYVARHFYELGKNARKEK